ncbi:MAG: sigma 54-interacting transcriptional regulator [Planctomycetota bacterium]|jgi:DNA-binding NtrC family response regulator
MLTRVTLVIQDKDLQDCIFDRFNGHDTITELLDSENIIKNIGRKPFDLLIISEEFLPENNSEFFQMISEFPETPEIIIISSTEDEKRRAELVSEGCSAVLYGGLPEESITDALSALLAKFTESRTEVLQSKHSFGDPSLSDFVSNSRSMQTFMGLAKRVVKSNSSILILGETGVGKERLALAIHAESSRSNEPFIPINCAALPDNLLESELFGHEQGAFTGASRMRRGAFEIAHKGTVFLDEIGDMPLALQAKLLRVLQDKQFTKVGGEKSIKVDVRIMAATNKDLTKEIEKGNFRQDLYYRLNVINLLIPPLRERKEDIADLVHSYISYLSPNIGVEVTSIDKKTIKALQEYHWPGNVRELINVLERAMLLCDGDSISLTDLPEEISGQAPLQLKDNKLLSGNISLSDEFMSKEWSEVRDHFTDKIEMAYFDNLLKVTEGRIAKTAKIAGITTRALYEKMKKHHLSKESYK